MSSGSESEPKDGGRAPDARVSRPVPGRALVRIAPQASKSSSVWTLRHTLWATGFAVALGIGAFGLQSVRTSTSWSATPDVANRQAEATAQLIRRLADEVGHLKGSVDTLRIAQDQTRQDDSLRGLRKSVDTLKQEIEQVRSADNATLTQLSAKFDKVDYDPTQKLADIAARLDRLDHDGPAKADAAAGQKLADLTSRLDRLEHQVSAPAATGSIPPVARVSTVAPAEIGFASVASQPRPVPRPDSTIAAASELKPLLAKPPTVDTWVVRDVYDGVALVEARRGDLREVAPGEFLPGAGQVRSIERRGRAWVVLTSRGVIETSTF